MVYTRKDRNKMTLDTYALEKIARGVLSKCDGDYVAALGKVDKVTEKYNLTGDQIMTFCDILLDCSLGLEI
jgi:hypothetical protein